MVSGHLALTKKAGGPEAESQYPRPVHELIATAPWGSTELAGQRPSCRFSQRLSQGTMVEGGPSGHLYLLVYRHAHPQASTELRLSEQDSDHLSQHMFSPIVFFLLIFPSLFFLEKENPHPLIVLKQYQDVGKGTLGVTNAFDFFPPSFLKKKSSLVPESKMSSTKLCDICSLCSSLHPARASCDQRRHYHGLHTGMFEAGKAYRGQSQTGQRSEDSVLPLTLWKGREDFKG